MATVRADDQGRRASRRAGRGARAALMHEVAELTVLALRTVEAVPARELAAVDRALAETRAALEAFVARQAEANGSSTTSALAPPSTSSMSPTAASRRMIASAIGP